MPRLFHTPPKYRRHKSTQQAIVEFGGKRVYLGPYGSTKSHERYREALEAWRKLRHDESRAIQQGCRRRMAGVCRSFFARR